MAKVDGEEVLIETFKVKTLGELLPSPFKNGLFLSKSIVKLKCKPCIGKK